MTERVYRVPASLMNKIVNVINAQPYAQIALLANEVGMFLDEENKRMNREEKERDGAET